MLHPKYHLSPSQDALGTSDHRLAIHISGGSEYSSGKLLAVPTIPDATGLSQAAAVLDVLEDWNCVDNVIGLCYDTTSSNTGSLKGAVTILDDIMRKKLLHLECRHHVLELIVGAVAATLFGKTTGPTEPKFEELKRR